MIDPDAILEPYHLDGCFILPMQSVNEMPGLETTDADGNFQTILYRTHDPQGMVHRRAERPLHAIAITAPDLPTYRRKVLEQIALKHGTFYAESYGGDNADAPSLSVTWVTQEEGQPGALDAAHADESPNVWYVWWRTQQVSLGRTTLRYKANMERKQHGDRRRDTISHTTTVAANEPPSPTTSQITRSLPIQQGAESTLTLSSDQTQENETEEGRTQHRRSSMHNNEATSHDNSAVYTPTLDGSVKLTPRNPVIMPHNEPAPAEQHRNPDDTSFRKTITHPTVDTQAQEEERADGETPDQNLPPVHNTLWYGSFDDQTSRTLTPTYQPPAESRRDTIPHITTVAADKPPPPPTISQIAGSSPTHNHVESTTHTSPGDQTRGNETKETQAQYQQSIMNHDEANSQEYRAVDTSTTPHGSEKLTPQDPVNVSPDGEHDEPATTQQHRNSIEPSLRKSITHTTVNERAPEEVRVKGETQDTNLPSVHTTPWRVSLDDWTSRTHTPNYQPPADTPEMTKSDPPAPPTNVVKPDGKVDASRP